MRPSVDGDRDDMTKARRSSDIHDDAACPLPLDEVVQLIERTTWRLIDTAPRDGTPIIAWDVDRTTPLCGTWVIARWRRGRESEDPEQGAWEIVPGLYALALSHWMPVPPQPAPSED
jgi:hypothetical protein